MVVSLGRRPRTFPLRRGLYACLVLAVLAAGCGEGAVGAGDVLPAAPLQEEDPGLVHVHGLGVNPSDGDLYVATHFGLWRVRDGTLERVGDAYHDLMGFVVAGADRFLASGHPLLVEQRLPPNLGLIESRDGGRTWRSVSLLGEVDFHALRYAHETVYGWDATSGTFMVSRDGRRWERRSVLRLLDFAVSPDDPDVLVASLQTDAGELVPGRSEDGGRTYAPGARPRAGRLAWSSTERLWSVDTDGVVSRSRDEGRTWTPVGRLDMLPEAFTDTGERLYAAAHGVLLTSADGASWEVFHPGG